MTARALLLEAATLEDLPALVALENRCHSHPWSEGGLRDAICPAAGHGAVLVLRGPAPPAEATRGIRAYCALQIFSGEAHVHNLAVIPEVRGQGLGRRLLALTLDIAAHRGARVVQLEVRAGNAAARALYRALGFQEVGLRRSYYSAPAEDAILLSRPSSADFGSLKNLERPSPKC